MINSAILDTKSKKNILIVDDIPANLKVLSKILIQKGYEIQTVNSGQMALEAVQNMLPDIILLDIKMPEIDGYEVCRQLKAEQKTCEIPIIFLSASDDAIDKVQAFEVGGSDYISKPFQLEEILVRIKNQLDLQSAKAEIYQLNAELEQKIQQRTNHLVKKINELEQARKLLYDTFYDQHTNLPNRNLFSRHLEQAIERLKERPNYGFAVLFIECSLSPLVKDSLEESSVARLLVDIVQRLQICIRQADTLCRFKDNEFAILFQEVNNNDIATSLAKRLQQKFLVSFSVDEHLLLVNTNIGIVLGTTDYQKPDHLLRDAKAAMHNAKKLGKSTYQLFEQLHSV